MQSWKLSRRLSWTGMCAAVAASLILMAVLVPSPSSARTTQTHASTRLRQVVVIMRTETRGLHAHSLTRASAIRREEAPVVSTLRARGIRTIRTGRAVPYLIARVSASQRAALARRPDVKLVVPNQRFQVTDPGLTTTASAPTVLRRHARGAHTAAPAPATGASTGPVATGGSAPLCGTSSKPLSEPEALTNIDAAGVSAAPLSIDGAGVKTAYMAGGIDTTVADFQRNPKYASPSSPAGSPVVTNINFSGDPSTAVDTGAGGESFLDASSIAAQGNETYDLAKYVNADYPTATSPCDITITGDAPGASVYGLQIFSDDYFTTTSNFVEAIGWAAAHGINVLNQSFGSDGLPADASDAIYAADDAAIADGVTVTVSSGDEGVSNTVGSPAIDPNVISLGATTTQRVYEQTGYAASKLAVANNSGSWLDNNISGLSSAGFAPEGGNTIDMVAPGDSSWVVCSTSPIFAADCLNAHSPEGPSPIDFYGGTSESAPLAAGAAADVIQAYSQTHGGADPSPALIKQILMSTATDLNTPAEQQGAGLLNVAAAVKEAEAINSPTSAPSATPPAAGAASTGAPTASGNAGTGASDPATPASTQDSVLISPDQVNITQNPGQSTSQPVSITNPTNAAETVNLSTRAFTQQLSDQTGSFCLNPSSTANSCGAPTTATFPSVAGVPEVYATQTFTVPAGHAATRLDLSAAYQIADGQNQRLNVALFDPSGTYAAYNRPTGVSGYTDLQVTDPRPGTWTAVFFTAQDDPSSNVLGTSSTILWQAKVSGAQPAGQISPSTLSIAPGQTATAQFTATSPRSSGDAGQSIVISTVGGSTNSIPVTVRTLIPTGFFGGSFSGTLTGGNGDNDLAQSNYYQFTVPPGQRDIAVSTSFQDNDDAVVAYLEDPEGQVVASSSNVTLDKSGTDVIGTNTATVYEDNPQPGTYHLLLQWLSPVSGMEISEPFSGQIRFNAVAAFPVLPAGPVRLQQGTTYHFDVAVRNTAQTPEAYFLDPRTNAATTYALPDLGGSDGQLDLPLSSYSIYSVPTHTASIATTVTGTVPVTFDEAPLAGDPDLSPLVSIPGASALSSGDSSSLTYAPGGEIDTGLWAVFPSEIGPYGNAGAPPASATVSFNATTLGFDPTVGTSTGDLWSADDGLTDTFTPKYLQPGQIAILPVTITPTAAPGTRVSGEINLDDTFQDDLDTEATEAGGDELGSYGYSYTVAAPPKPPKPPHHPH